MTKIMRYAFNGFCAVSLAVGLNACKPKDDNADTQSPMEYKTTPLPAKLNLTPSKDMQKEAEKADANKSDDSDAAKPDEAKQ